MTAGGPYSIGATVTDGGVNFCLFSYGTRLNRPDCGPDSHAVALGAELKTEGLRFHLILNAFWEPLEFELPPRDGGGPCLRWIDTSYPSPHDIVEWKAAPPVPDGTYRAGPRSVVMLYSEISVRPAR